MLYYVIRNLAYMHGYNRIINEFIVMSCDRGSQAMKFFNSRQIKCKLERHPSAEGLQKWKGDHPVRIDPLATLQVSIVGVTIIINGCGLGCRETFNHERCSAAHR